MANLVVTAKVCYLCLYCDVLSTVEIVEREREQASENERAKETEREKEIEREREREGEKESLSLSPQVPETAADPCCPEN